MGQRSVLEPDVWLSAVSDEARIVIGEYTFIGRSTEISASLRVEIGRGCLIGPGVYITDHNHSVLTGRPMFEQPCPAAAVHIGDDVWLGAHCIVLPGVRIGSGAVIGAGAVVTRDVEAGTIAGGVPARMIATRAESVSKPDDPL